jgi:hypothetical protein
VDPSRAVAPQLEPTAPAASASTAEAKGVRGMSEKAQVKLAKRLCRIRDQLMEFEGKKLDYVELNATQDKLIIRKFKKGSESEVASEAFVFIEFEGGEEELAHAAVACDDAKFEKAIVKALTKLGDN